ncbi:flagellar basal body rod protein FlgB [Candidatus Laterigemmans baculatus]|uniref:flagellar basal body rod protein FlgB n=1 Tax=Candidatus Laterigemmans baculatus TaxID=2770505 RepID=UPI0013D8F0DD|nr:flagellar basal body rod protein FlgB [Candidatus Laterigemmans baculatus]
MIQGLFQSTTLPALEQTTAFAARRHELLAGNIANVDTPDYRARDLSVSNFEQSLAAAIDAQRNPGELPPLASPGGAADDPMAGPRAAMETLVYHDGSDVNLERQVTEMSKNQSLHNMAISLMRHQFSVLRAAISERV